ncbi:MAG: rhodanese-like domain-containing protein [Boseongicola sp.]|nr:rhodanese-like domain-containing protein [Boseongicola sp.]
MSGASGSPVGEVSPDVAWRILEEDSSALLIDVRTRAEWGFVGVPELSEVGQSTIFVEWVSFPNMSANPQFVAEVMEAIGDRTPSKLLFICRSGVRSLRAATTIAEHFSENEVTADCLNVAEGFEGDLDPQGHRGRHNGWKARGLAWRQS